MADWTVEQLKAERGNILDEMARHTLKAATVGEGMRNELLDKIAALERQVGRMNLQINRLNGAVYTTDTGTE